MATPTREQVMQALFTQLSTAYAFVYAARQFKSYADLDQSQMPAFMLLEHGEDVVLGAVGQPPERTWHATVVVYTYARNIVNPVTLLNPIIDALEDALAPDFVTMQQTLGGLVYNAWFEGHYLKDPGDLDGIGLVTMPVKILVP